jgi:hypothetical protein
LPVVVATQNMLMRKLGMTSSQHLETMDFDHYIQLFESGLSEQQVQMINKLIIDKPPAPEDEVAEETV